jgi:hypothetical protein
MDIRKTGIAGLMVLALIGMVSAQPFGMDNLAERGENCPIAAFAEGRGSPIDEEQRSQVHDAVVLGEWDQYSSLVGELDLTQGIHPLMTEDAFELFSHIAQLQEELMELRQELAEELGLEELPGKGHMGRGMGQNPKNFGPRHRTLEVEE